MLFRTKYTVRHYEKQSFENGYAHQPYTESIQSLNVQPANNSPNSNEFGFGNITRLNCWSSYVFTVANQEEGIKGDRIKWHGHWYECTSSVYWDGTPLKHCMSTFALVPEHLENS